MKGASTLLSHGHCMARRINDSLLVFTLLLAYTTGVVVFLVTSPQARCHLPLLSFVFILTVAGLARLIRGAPFQQPCLSWRRAGWRPHHTDTASVARLTSLQGLLTFNR
jgi:hypothetical protein